jgi:hypothetical protein
MVKQASIICFANAPRCSVQRARRLLHACSLPFLYPPQRRPPNFIVIIPLNNERAIPNIRPCKQQEQFGFEQDKEWAAAYRRRIARGKSVQTLLTGKLRRIVSGSRESVRFCCWVSASHVLCIPFWSVEVVPFVLRPFLWHHSWTLVPLKVHISRGWEWPFVTLCRGTTASALMTCSFAAGTFEGLANDIF